VRDYPELVDAAFATTVTASAPIVAERAMYWGGFIEGTATAGVTDEHTRWAFAEGLAGVFGGNPYETFYLFLNASGSPITLTGSFYREDGYGTRQQYTIPANSRFTLYAAAVPHLLGQKFGAVFEGDPGGHSRVGDGCGGDRVDAVGQYEPALWADQCAFCHHPVRGYRAGVDPAAILEAGDSVDAGHRWEL